MVWLLLSFVALSLILDPCAAALPKVVCYFQNSNGYSLAPPEQLDANLCTHINYAFIECDESGNLTVQNAALDIDLGLYSRVVNMKSVNPALKVLLSVGSTSATIFSMVAADPAKRRNFVASAKYFLQKYGFDGLDIDWERPVANDTEPFAALLGDLRKEFNRHGWILSAAVYPNAGAGYKPTAMARYLDIFNVMAYNYYGSWSSYTGQNAALFSSPIESNYEKSNLNAAASIRNWINEGVPRAKLVLGLAFYGRSFTLVDPKVHGLHAPIIGSGKVASPSFRQICTGYNNWTTVWDGQQRNPYKYLGDQWLGYDDKRSIKEKVRYIVSQNLAGAMVWHIGSDDLKGECGPKQGLLKLVNDEFKTAYGKI